MQRQRQRQSHSLQQAPASTHAAYSPEFGSLPPLTTRLIEASLRAVFEDFAEGMWRKSQPIFLTPGGTEVREGPPCPA